MFLFCFFVLKNSLLTVFYAAYCLKLSVFRLRVVKCSLFVVHYYYLLRNNDTKGSIAYL